MKTKSLTLSFALAALALACPAARLLAEAPLVVNMIAYDTMKYSVTKFEAHPGQKVTIKLKSEGMQPKEVMGHNLVVLKAGEDAVAYANAAITDKAEGYEPKKLAGKVLASIPQLGPKETGSTTFTVPAKAGTYPFLCSFPAHCMAGMRGVMVVK